MNNHKPTKKKKKKQIGLFGRRKYAERKDTSEVHFLQNLGEKCPPKKRRAKGKKSWIFYDHINPALNCTVCSSSGEVYCLIRADISLSQKKKKKKKK